MFHPTRASWALLSVWTEDCKLKNPGAPCTHKLLVTEASQTLRRIFVARAMC